MQTTPTKGDTVFYRSAAGVIVRASIATMHRDGSVSVAAQFYVDDAHADLPGYLGFKFRLASDDLYLSPPCCLPLQPAFNKTTTA